MINRTLTTSIGAAVLVGAAVIGASASWSAVRCPRGYTCVPNSQYRAMLSQEQQSGQTAFQAQADQTAPATTQKAPAPIHPGGSQW